MRILKNRICVLVFRADNLITLRLCRWAEFVFTLWKRDVFSVNFKILCNQTDIEFECKKSSLLQVFINLINNAVDAIEDLQEKWIKLHIILQDEQIVFTVMDSGKGVALENQVKLFEPFFTTKDIGKGTGLGLSISRNIVEEHSGSLNYVNQMHHSCFLITLPRLQKKSD